MTTNRQQLRQSLLDTRAALSPAERQQKAVLAALALRQYRGFRRARHIGLYTAVGAECPTLPIRQQAEIRAMALHYPRIDLRRPGRMSFVHADTSTQWLNNRFGIPEPQPTAPDDFTHVRALDVIIMPLVGFDARGNRLGMGAGYYDRLLEFRRHRRHWKRPLLIGLAYDCQQTDRIPQQPWDVPLDAVATESGLNFFHLDTLSTEY